MEEKVTGVTYTIKYDDGTEEIVPCIPGEAKLLIVDATVAAEKQRFRDNGPSWYNYGGKRRRSKKYRK